MRRGSVYETQGDSQRRLSVVPNAREEKLYRYPGYLVRYGDPENHILKFWVEVKPT